MGVVYIADDILIFGKGKQEDNATSVQLTLIVQVAHFSVNIYETQCMLSSYTKLEYEFTPCA